MDFVGRVLGVTGKRSGVRIKRVLHSNSWADSSEDLRMTDRAGYAFPVDPLIEDRT
jgi:hypothetical protein